MQTFSTDEPRRDPVELLPAAVTGGAATRSIPRRDLRAARTIDELLESDKGDR